MPQIPFFLLSRGSFREIVAAVQGRIHTMCACGLLQVVQVRAPKAAKCERSAVEWKAVGTVKCSSIQIGILTRKFHQNAISSRNSFIQSAFHPATIHPKRDKTLNPETLIPQPSTLSLVQAPSSTQHHPSLFLHPPSPRFR